LGVSECSKEKLHTIPIQYLHQINDKISMRRASMLKIEKKDQPRVEVFEGVVRHTLACGKDVLMARFEYKKGSQVPSHQHYYEQVTTVLEGKQSIIINSNGKQEKIVVETGDSYIVPPGFVHEQISLEDTITIDAWSIAP
jgi:quercetin dioxygenase-like cupin family protein